MTTSPDYLLSLVDQRVKDIIHAKFTERSTTDIDNCLVELMKYLYLVSKYPKQLAGTFVPITQEMDDMWHQMILQTRYYIMICDRLPGKRLVHHESMPFTDYVDDKEEDSSKLVPEILRWIPFYVKNFGDIEEDALRYWCFFSAILEIKPDLTLSDLNTLAKNDQYFTMDDSSAMNAH